LCGTGAAERPHFMKRALFSLALLSSLCLNSGGAHGSEICTINGNTVLLYKIINFWYDCLPEEADQLCGARLECRSREQARIEYQTTASVLKIHIPSGFARLVSVAGGRHLQCTWLNQAYFGGGQALDLTDDTGAEGFTFTGIKEAQARSIRAMAKEIRVEIKGGISGLLNGKIALYQGRDFLKTCPEEAEGTPALVKLVNSRTREVLAVYSQED
jgi:hypothetical protein